MWISLNLVLFIANTFSRPKVSEMTSLKRLFLFKSINKKQEKKCVSFSVKGPM